MLKLKIRAPEFVLGILLTVALIAIGMMYESSHHPTSNHTNYPAATERDKPSKLGRSNCFGRSCYVPARH
jgi:hypothetical protein